MVCFSRRETDAGSPLVYSLYSTSFFSEFVHSVAMVSHAITVTSKTVEYLSIACDQPLFAIAKTIQWSYKDSTGEDKLVAMFGEIQHVYVSRAGSSRNLCKLSSYLQLNKLTGKKRLQVNK